MMSHGTDIGIMLIDYEVAFRRLPCRLDCRLHGEREGHWLQPVPAKERPAVLPNVQENRAPKTGKRVRQPVRPVRIPEDKVSSPLPPHRVPSWRQDRRENQKHGHSMGFDPSSCSPSHARRLYVLPVHHVHFFGYSLKLI